jgi:outer membrane protein
MLLGISVNQDIHSDVTNRTRRCAARLLLVIFGTTPTLTAAVDVFRTESQIPATPTAALGITANVCQVSSLPVPLTLSAVVDRSLCASPKTRSSWLAIKSAAAVVGQSKAAYLPTLTATSQYNRQHYDTQIADAPQLQSGFTSDVNTESLSLSWVLYDFGGRAASLKSSQALLTAARANENMTLQSVFSNAAKDYYAAQAARAKVESAGRSKSTAQQSLDAAIARVNKGVAPITDQLQTDTALAQAIYDLAKAESDYRIALGTLATDMGDAPDEPLILPGMDGGALPDTEFVRAVHELIQEAQKTHPSVVAAEAQWQAALAKLSAVRAQGLPTVSLQVEADRSNQPISASLGEPEYPAVTHDNYVGVKVTIPLFEGFNREYLIRQAQADAQQQAQSLRDAQQQIALGVWSSFQTLEADTDNLHNTDAVLQSAQSAFDAIQHRYRSGVGSILEVLSVQKGLAIAEQQRIQALLDWRTARLQLAASLGQLGMWALE